MARILFSQIALVDEGGMNLNDNSIVTRSFQSSIDSTMSRVSAAFYERELVISPSRAHLPTWLPRGLSGHG